MSLSKESILTRFLRVYVKTLHIDVQFQSDIRFPSIVVFWHGRMFLLPFVFKNYARDVTVLISRHGDGDLAAKVIEKLGFSTVRGSTGRGKGGERAFLQMLNVLKKGRGVVITPDGPIGPKEVLKLGVAKLSMMGNVPVYPVTFSTSKGKQLSSWDSFLIPYPFSRCKVVVGRPIYPEENEGLESFRKRLELSLRNLTNQLDREMRWKT